MLRLIGLVVSIGLADSLNPSTIAPALYLAGGTDARVKVTEFALGVFAVYLLGGLAIALGPGQLVVSLLPRPGRHLGYELETVAGVGMLVAAAILWSVREQLASREARRLTEPQRSSALLGAMITALELPTAFPYFAAIAAVVGANLGAAKDVVLIVLFNLCFVAPLIGIVATLMLAPANAERWLSVSRRRLESHWPAILAALALAAGLFVVALGVTGIVSLHRNAFGRLARRLRRILRP
jgi:cytochrome c biogenesis protein CcdA